MTNFMTLSKTWPLDSNRNPVGFVLVKIGIPVYTGFKLIQIGIPVYTGFKLVQIRIPICPRRNQNSSLP